MAYRENPRAEEARAETLRLFASAHRVAERRRARKLAGWPLVVGYVVASLGSLALVDAWRNAGPYGRIAVAFALLGAPAFAAVSFALRSAANRVVRARLGDRAFSEARVPAAELRTALRGAERGVGTRPPIAGVVCVCLAAQVLVEPAGMYLMMMVSLLAGLPLWTWLGAHRLLSTKVVVGILALIVSGSITMVLGMVLGRDRALAMLCTAWVGPPLLSFLASRSVAAEERALTEVRRALLEAEASQDGGLTVRDTPRVSENGL